MTKNNQKTYERPELQVLFVETESVMVTDSYGTAGAAGAQGDFLKARTIKTY